MRRVCKANGLQKEEIKSMFGSCRAIWRIAGLPHPGEEAKTYMS
jgi:tRNA 2-thiouridine synthesizing protein E